MSKKVIPSPEPEDRSSRKLSRLYDGYHEYIAQEARILLHELDYFAKHPGEIKIRKEGMTVNVQNNTLSAMWRCPSEFDDWSNSGNVVNVQYQLKDNAYIQQIVSRHFYNGVNLFDAGMVFTPQTARNKVKFSLYLLYFPQAVVPQYLRDQCTDPRTGWLQFQYFKGNNSNMWTVSKWDKSRESYLFWEIGHDGVEAQLSDAFFEQANNMIPGVKDYRFDPYSYDQYGSLVPRAY